MNRKANVRETHQTLLHLGTWEIDLTRWELHCSEEVYKIYHLPSKSEKERPTLFTSYVHPSDQHLVEHLWRLVIRGERIGRNFTYRIVVGGACKFIQFNLQYHYDEAGVLDRINGSMREIAGHMSDLFSVPNVEESFGFERETNEAAIVIDKEIGIVRVNKNAEGLFGWTTDELLFRYPPMVPLSYKESMGELYQVLMEQGGTIWFDTLRVCKDGSMIDVSVSLSSIRNNEGIIVGAIGLYRNYYMQFDVPEVVLDSESQFQELVENSCDVSLILNEELEIKYVSPAIDNVLSFSPRDLLQENFLLLICPSDRFKFEGNLNKLLTQADSKVVTELRLKNKQGDSRFCHVTIKRLNKNSRLKGVIVNFHDITERKETQKLVHYVTGHDYLTDLPNRRTFEEQLLRLINRSQTHKCRFAVLMLSLNKFKFLNDSLGHSIGDKLIQLFAMHIQDRVPSESIVARIGGDEFAVLIPNITDRNIAFSLANNLLKVFEQPLLVEQYSVYMTAGIGISFYPTDGTDTETLLRNTDVALHRAKEHGQNSFQAYQSTLDTGTYKSFSLSNDFRKALQNNEFLVYYQPRMETLTNRIVAAEALIRWKHPEWGLVSPIEFIHIAENSGQIVNMGRWVLEAVCRNLSDWSKLGLPDIKVSVNISAQQLLSDKFVDSVRNILRGTNVSPQRLEFEITETSILPDDSKIVETIKQLREMGILIYFDDFGTGYSSLSWLHRFELDGIKLDHSFMSHVPHHWAPTQIVKSIIHLAKELKLFVVAEGVETNQQLTFLIEEKCDQVQGYLYSRPIPVEEFFPLLKQRVLLPAEERNPYKKTEDNRRQHFRVDLSDPLVGQVTIAKLNERELSLGFSDILVLDISPGGLRFVSKLRLPTKNDILLRFHLKLMDRPTELFGYVVWNRSVTDDLFQYGVQLMVDEGASEFLVRSCNDLLVRTATGSSMSGYDVFTEGVDIFFSNQAH
jgi:diguanylate cyclase (GGDEF)-like protein/PAS domain S-box-containing protein